ncbi:hypothetical protein RJ55_04475 [Drechmeria coniospora]|nr:hypothetical protein RJ55_04475 [Drechmeria coniospora]
MKAAASIGGRQIAFLALSCAASVGHTQLIDPQFPLGTIPAARDTGTVDGGECEPVVRPAPVCKVGSVPFQKTLIRRLSRFRLLGKRRA